MMRVSRNILAPMVVLLLCVVCVAVLVFTGQGRAQSLEGEDDFSTGDRAMNWNVDAPNKAVLMIQFTSRVLYSLCIHAHKVSHSV